MILEHRSAVLAMYELGVGEGYRDPDAIKRRYFTLPTLDEDNTMKSPNAQLSAIRIDINVKWMNAAQELLDAVLACSTETMRKMPNLMYTRFAMAVTSLLKIHFSVRTGALGEVVTAESVNVEYYLDALAHKLSEASGGGKYKIPTRWYHVVAVRGRDWLERLEKRYTGSTTGDVGPRMFSDTPSTSTEPMPSTAQFQSPQDQTAHIEPVHQSAVDSFSVPHGLPNNIPPGMESMRDGYAAMSGTGMWPVEGSHGQSQFFQPMAGGYQSSHAQAQAQAHTIPPQFGYEAQRMPAQSQGGGGGQMSGGMELDGWLPDGSIFGMPPLPEF